MTFEDELRQQVRTLGDILIAQSGDLRSRNVGTNAEEKKFFSRVCDRWRKTGLDLTTIAATGSVEECKAALEKLKATWNYGG